MAAAKKPPAKKAAKPAAKKAVVKKAVKKPAPKKGPAARKAPVPSKKAAKPVKAVKAAKPTRPVARPPVKVEARPAPAPLKKTIARSARPETPVRKEVPPIAPLPIPAVVAPKPAPAPSPKDLAAAHEYLLARSATRSEEVTVNGRRLPTEGELLKMPDSSYMNEEQLAFFKHRLQQMERELLQNADETTEHLRETVIVPDPADRATIEEEHALELRTRDRERKLLKKVQQALGRIEAGDYGFCEETGDPIGIPRLLARPTATLSLEAQQRREMKQKMYGD
jgi:DnaK suppressor protein